MKTVTQIGVLSLAKVQAVITCLVYLIIGAVVNIIGARNPALVSDFGLPPGLMGIAGFALTGIIMGFVLGALVGWMYNLIAPKIGGIQVEIK